MKGLNNFGHLESVFPDCTQRFHTIHSLGWLVTHGRHHQSATELEMEAAVGAANWLLGKMVSKLSDDLVAGYVASRELGLNYDKITDELNHTLGLLHAAQGRDVSKNPWPAAPAGWPLQEGR
jgi:hypothetical protein